MDDLYGKIIVIYDGECNFCDATVHFILRRESFPFCYFTHLTSKTGKKIAADFGIPEDYDGLLYLEDGRLFGKSEAVLRLSRYLRFPYPLISFFFFIPAKLRDWVYDLFAKRRYKWFGKKECEIPEDEILKKRFLE